MEKVEDLIIIGGGPAGYTAAIYAAREEFRPLVIGGALSGGQLMLTSAVENYPGFPDGILGPELMDLFRKQAERFGARFVDDNVSGVDFSKRPFSVFVDKSEYRANCVIIATGASAKWLGIESEQKFIGKGVSSCATCDAPFFKNKDAIVVGGGDTAMEDSMFLTKFARSVTIVHRRDSFKASRIMQEKAKSNPKIKIMLNSAVEEITGNEKVTGAKIKNTASGETTDMKIDGVFVAIGHSPNTAFLNGALKLDEHGYIMTKDEVKTDIDGVFVAGDVSDRVYRQAVTASGSGTKAALEARNYLHGLGKF
ncbi:MAG: thioredoxin-disulfide reductase [Candidatus Micrarchaeota archaeon]|nr:thioredoxin-disulfide reductase [Candidatus Micrarchaeota archaeon]